MVFSLNIGGFSTLNLCLLYFLLVFYSVVGKGDSEKLPRLFESLSYFSTVGRERGETVVELGRQRGETLEELGRERGETMGELGRE